MNSLINISLMLPALIWIISSAFLFASFDVLMRFWYENSQSLFFVAGFITGVIGLFCLAMSFPHHNIAVAIVVSILINIILYMIAAYFIFGDTITYKEGIGLIIGFAAIYVLEGMK